MSSEESVSSTAAGPTCAYLILSHKSPAQVEALTRRILQLSPRAQVVIHHDLTGGPSPWSAGAPARVHLVERTTVEWGRWSIVEASLRAMRYAHEELGCQWLVLLSGEHWPVKDLSGWELDVAASGADVVMPAETLPRRLRFGPSNRDANRDLARCRLRWFGVRRPRRAALHNALSALSKVSQWTHPVCRLEYSMRNESWFVGVPRKQGALKGWDLHKGSEWFACNARAAVVLLDADPSISSWFQRSHIPDESYFQSLLCHARGLVVHHAVVTWVPPQPRTPTPGWFLLEPDHLSLVAASGAAFARKVDQDRNPEVMAAIDAMVAAGRTVVGAAS